MRDDYSTVKIKLRFLKGRGGVHLPPTTSKILDIIECECNHTDSVDREHLIQAISENFGINTTDASKRFIQRRSVLISNNFIEEIHYGGDKPINQKRK